MKNPLAILSPAVVAELQQHLSEIQAGPFLSREYNVIIPDLIAEMLRLFREVR